jgi:hypothetical protein
MQARQSAAIKKMSGCKYKLAQPLDELTGR